MGNNQEIIVRIRRALLNKKMTQRDLAVALGKKEAEISRWLNGRMGISNPNLQKIEDILETALTENSLAREKQAYLRLGVIGTGSIAKRFVEETVYVPNVYVASAYNPNFAETHQFCEMYGIMNEAINVEELLKEVDAVYIASPCYSHFEYIQKALNANKHVLCETPLTDNYPQAKELVGLAKKLGRTRQTLWGGRTDANPKLSLNDT